MFDRRIPALVVALALMLVPAVGRAKQRVDPPNARPRLSAPYRSIDVRPAPTLVAPDTSAAAPVEPDQHPQPFDAVDASRLPPVPDLSDPGSLRGPPLR